MSDKKPRRIHSEAIDWLSKKETPEEKAERYKRNKEISESITAEYKLGHLVGDLVWATKMPTMSCDMIQSKTVIPIPEDEILLKEYNHASDISYTYALKLGHVKTSEQELEHKRLFNIGLAFYHALQEKYLPKEFQFWVDIPIKDSPEFRRGMRDSLWNCDGCHYSLKEEDIIMEERLFQTIFTFKNLSSD